MKPVNYAGQTFDRLRVESFHHRNARGQSYWLCRCTCGGSKVVAGYHLKSRDVQSCGCLQKERQRWSGTQTRTHGQGYGTKTYKLWQNMKDRCLNPNNRFYANYGGRGITVCDRWLTFEQFFEDMGECPPELSIERKRNHEGYSPDNCIYAPRTVQQRNKRTTKFYWYHDQSLALPAVAEQSGIPLDLLRDRLRQGWTLEKALTEPRRGYRKRH